MSQNFNNVNHEDKSAHLAEKHPPPTEVYCRNKNQVTCLENLKVPCEFFAVNAQLHTLTQQLIAEKWENKINMHHM